VIDAPSEAILQGIVQRESRSLLQYVADSFPWTTEDEKAVLGRIQQMIEEERQGVGDLIGFMVRRRLTLPYLGTYPGEFTTINYVSLDHLMPLLVDEERRALLALESNQAQLEQSAVSSQQSACAQVQKLLDMKRRHLQTLEKLAASHPQPAAAS
jgi:hypothetical protein